MNGREKCELNNKIRQKIAEDNNINFVIYECDFEGECNGTCPKSEAELKYLEKEISKKQDAGEKIKLDGIFTLESDNKYPISPIDKKDKIALPDEYKKIQNKTYDENDVGIYFGSCYSVASVLRNGEPVIVPTAGGSYKFPNYIAFTNDGMLLVGEAAKKQAHLNPENTISGIRRETGSNYTFKNKNRIYYLRDVLAFILKKIKKDTELFLGKEVAKAVITVPAYFDENQKKEIVSAGIIAGFDFGMHLNEAIAACLAYGIDAHTYKNLNILVFDMGMGALDITIIKIDNGFFKIKSISGDASLGSTDITACIKKHLADEFKKEHGIDLLKDEKTNRRLMEAAEMVKIELSHTGETQINLPYIAVSKNELVDLNSTINQSQLKSILNPVMKKCGENIQRALDNAVMDMKDIDKIILTGEGSRIPFVQEYIEKYVGMPIEKEIDPVQCMAQGAAIRTKAFHQYEI